MSYGQSGNNPPTDSIYARQYNTAGQALGSSEFQVSPTTSLSQTLPDVAMDNAGDFVIVWQSDQAATQPAIEGQYYRSTGAPVGSMFTVNTTTSSIQATPRVAMDAAGDFVVTWASFQNPTTGYDIYARRYTPGAVAAARTVQGEPNGDRLAHRPRRGHGRRRRLHHRLVRLR